MKRIGKFTIVMIAINVISASGQTRTEIETKLGQPLNAYQISERIWMSPEYASDGQVCRMTFYPRRFSSATTYLINELPFDEYRSGGRWVNFSYERVTISYVASFRVNTALGTGEQVKLDDDEVSKRQEKPKPIKDIFSLYSGSTAEIVTVQWNDRKCGGK